MNIDSNAETYFKGLSGGNNMSIRVCVPAYERMMQLYAFGHNATQIAEILHQEFADIDYNPITPSSVKKIIELNQTEFQIARMNLGLKCREKIQEQISVLFAGAQDVELAMQSVYTNQLRNVLNQLAEVDVGEQDEEGNYVKTARFFVLLEMAEKLQSKISKLAGTDALREIEVYRQKAEAKQQAENDRNSLLPKANGRTVDAETKPNFI